MPDKQVAVESMAVNALKEMRPGELVTTVVAGVDLAKMFAVLSDVPKAVCERDELYVCAVSVVRCRDSRMAKGTAVYFAEIGRMMAGMESPQATTTEQVS